MYSDSGGTGGKYTLAEGNSRSDTESNGRFILLVGEKREGKTSNLLAGKLLLYILLKLLSLMHFTGKTTSRF